MTEVLEPHMPTVPRYDFRVETMVLMGMELPLEAVRRQIASVELVHLERARDGKRQVAEIADSGI